MDYEKKYKEALGWMASLYDGLHGKTKEEAERYFPELAESEGEKMIQYFKDLAPFDKADELYEKYGFSHKDAIAWLEKQGGHTKFINGIQVGDKVTRNEDGVLVNLSQLNRVAKKDEKQGKQKPADKVEPNFRKGDWVVYCNDDVDLITGIEENGYTINEGGYIPFVCASDIRLWTIQDAKDGDVLVSESKCGLNTWYCIFKSLDDDESMTVYCYLARDERFQTMEELCFNKDPRDVKPATKEQRELLFQKMKEAGYEWDADKKELMKVEQKHAAWSEEDEKQARQIERIVHDDGCTQKLQKQIADWFKSLKERVQPQKTWKPSDEQMKALKDALNDAICQYDFKGSLIKEEVTRKHAETIESLYNDLKKL